MADSKDPDNTINPPPRDPADNLGGEPAAGREGAFPFLDPPSLAFDLAERVIAALRTLPADASLTSTRAHVAGALLDPLGEVIDRVRRETIADDAERAAVGELRRLVGEWAKGTEIRIARRASDEHDEDSDDEGTETDE